MNKKKTTFSMRKGLFKSLRMSFGLTNTVVFYQEFINGILAAHLDRYIMAYEKNISIYSSTREERIYL